MAELDIFDEAPEKWFDFLDDSEVLLKYVSQEVADKIAKKMAEISQKTKGLADLTIQKKLIARYAVLGWRKKIDHNHPGLTVNGEPVEFTPQNVDRLAIKSFDFWNFVDTKSSDASGFRSKDEIKIDAIADELFGHDIETTTEGPDASKNG